MNEEPYRAPTHSRGLLLAVMISIFATAWVWTKEPVEIYAGYAVILVLLPVYMFRFGIPGRFWAFFGFFLFTGVFNVLFGNNVMDQFVKIFLGVMMSYLFYYYVLQRFDYDVEALFSYYVKGIFIISIIGLIQFISYQVKFRPGYDFTWTGIFNKWGVPAGGNLGIRVNSIFNEPSTLATVAAPAMFVAVRNLVTSGTYILKRWQSALVLVVFLLTFSSVGFIGLFIALVLLMVNYGFARFLFLFFPLLIVSFIYLYNNVEDFRYRFDSTVYLFEHGEVDISSQHGSSIVFYNNFVVATENVGNNFLWGSGLGSHPVAFERYSITKNITTFGFSNNNADANSMLLRIISETGLIGVVFVFIFIRRFFVRRDVNDEENPYWIISASCLCVIMLYLLRQGHYFLNGFPFFVWLYYYTRKKADERELEMEELAEAEETMQTGEGDEDGEQ